MHKRTGSRPRWPHDEARWIRGAQARQESSAAKVGEGQRVFRFETFGDEQLWTDKLRLNEVVEKNVDPTTALMVGLKVDAAVLPAGILEKIDLKSPATTVALAVGTLENGRLFAYRCLVKDLAFAQPSTSGLPRHSRLTYGIAAVVHILVFALLIHVTTQPRRVSSAGSPYGSMTTYVAGPIAAGQAVAPAKPVEPKKTALATRTATAVPKDDQAGAGTSAGSAGVAGGQAGTGPVRLGTDGNLTLIKKVTPIYPTLMQSARMTGQVVLDAIIHPDGTIGDIRVLRSTNDAFAQSAIAAVKQWRYTAPGFEGILTVSVNFTLAA